jgi:hypothetical protein
MAVPLDGVDGDIGAAVDRHHAVAVKAPALLDQLQRQFELDQIIATRFEQPKADALARRSFGG